MKRAMAVVAAALVLAMTGCVGYVDGGPGPDVVVGGGPVVLGGFYGPGRDVHAFHDRGFHSRGVAHPGHFGGHR